MSIALLVITDGRDDYLHHCLTSARQHLHGPISERWMFDDTGDDPYRARLAATHDDFTHINAGPRQGFGGAIAAAWAWLLLHSNAQWVFHLEQDFVLTCAVDLAAIADVLTQRPHLAQMALRRQAWSAQEHAAGGVVECQPTAYTEYRDTDGHAWLEHRLFFTTNPSLYRRELCVTGWPAGAQSEGHFSHHLLRNGAGAVPGDAVKYGYWGARDSGIWTQHIGHRRAGIGY